MNKRQFDRLSSTGSCAFWTLTVILGVLASGQSAALTRSLPTAEVSIATQIQEVQRGTIDGRDFLTVHIGGHEIGPSSCKSNILRMDSMGETGASRQEEIETIAFSAMLSASTVIVVVPLETNQCVDGKPTFTDMYPLTSR